MKTHMLMLWLFFLVITLAGCGPPQVTPNIYQKFNSYPCTFSGREALFIRERNGSPYILASAFLIDKQKGLFASAKHFVGIESDGNAKIFFNCRVYNGFLVKLPPVADIAIIKIQGDFDATGFPEPYKIAHKINLGNKVLVRGIHPHPKVFRKNMTVIPIFREYYGILGRDDEFVFDDLGGKITKLKASIQNKKIGGSSELLAEISNNFIELDTNEDHHFSFGGLSGGPTINELDELVGINSNEVQGGLEMEQKGRMVIITTKAWKTFHLVPASELEKLLPQLTDIR